MRILAATLTACAVLAACGSVESGGRPVPNATPGTTTVPDGSAGEAPPATAPGAPVSGIAPPTTAPQAGAAAPSGFAAVKPLFTTYCGGCHGVGSRRGDYVSQTRVDARKASVASEIKRGSMPPNGMPAEAEAAILKYCGQ